MLAFMAWRLVLAFVVASGCTPQEKVDAPQPAFPPPQRSIVNAGETCTPGASAPRCADGLRCVEQPHQKLPPREPGKVNPPEQASDVGGSCGGVAGYHCAEGLDCSMAPDQVMVADGMGTCTLHGICAK